MQIISLCQTSHLHFECYFDILWCYSFVVNLREEIIKYCFILEQYFFHNCCKGHLFLCLEKNFLLGCVNHLNFLDWFKSVIMNNLEKRIYLLVCFYLRYWMIHMFKNFKEFQHLVSNYFAIKDPVPPRME